MKMLWQLQSALLLMTTATFAHPFSKSSSPRLPPAFIHEGDSLYDIHNSKLREALKCPYGNPTSSSKSVLLVHGSGATGSGSWSKGYMQTLLSNGYKPCYLELPRNGMGDLQQYSAYVAYNLHHLSWLANGGHISIIGHGQANSVIQWALQFFPSTRHVTGTYIGLSPNLLGTTSTSNPEGCETLDVVNEERCRPFAWQQRQGSQYYEALHHKYRVAQVSTTLIWSENDEVITPAEQNAYLPGAQRVRVQDLCPGRVVSHEGMLTDAATFHLVLDALRNNGRANVNRLRPHSLGTCAKQSLDAPQAFKKIWKWVQNQNVLASPSTFDEMVPKVAHEPAIKPYAQLRNQ